MNQLLLESRSFWEVVVLIELLLDILGNLGNGDRNQTIE
jgi:hypothetical protein